MRLTDCVTIGDIKVKKTNIIAATVGLAVLLATSSSALASPAGAYIDLMGGASYLPGAKLDHMTFPANDQLGNDDAVPSYKNSTAYTTRMAVGYFFNKNPKCCALVFGVEAGYNYFFPVKSSSEKTFSSVGSQYKVNGVLKSKAWSTDLDFVVSQNLSKNISLIYKAGIAYEKLSRRFTATQASGPQEHAFDSKTNGDVSGIGGLVGVGMQYSFNQNLALRAEVDGMKGGKDIGYVQGLIGLAWEF